jgi:hypothetical protein
MGSNDNPLIPANRPESFVMRHLKLEPVEGTYAICRLGPGATIPDWAVTGEFVSFTRTTDEVSIVCSQETVPPGVQCERGWRCLRVAGVLEFTATGVLAALIAPMAAGGIGLFVVSTFDTDYLLIRDRDLDRVVEILANAGHSIRV